MSGEEGRGRAALREARVELRWWTRGSTLAGRRGARAPQQPDTPGVSWRRVGHPDRVPLGEPLTGLFDFCVSLKLKSLLGNQTFYSYFSARGEDVMLGSREGRDTLNDYI